MNSGPQESPNILGGSQRRGFGVRRLNRLPLVFAIAIGVAILGAVFYTYEQRRAANQARIAAQDNGRPEPVGAIGVLKDAPTGGLIAAKVEPQPAPPPPPVERQRDIAEIDPNREAWERYRQHLERLQQDRQQAAAQALGAPTQVSGQSFGAKPDQPSTASSATPESFAAVAARLTARQTTGGAADTDLNRGEEKRQFLAEQSPKSLQANYLPAIREAPLSPYEVKAGTIIPAVMVGGINSDLPGQLIGQVSENVYDTATGRFILIPQGAKLIGTYDNEVTTGQERVLVAWTRLIYPDASSIDLGRMPGTDQSGYAGFNDRVNDHFWKTFGSAVMMSLFSGALQLSQGQGSNGSGNGMNAQQTMTASLGQQMGQLGMEIARRNLQVQPTLEVRPGYRFTVTVTKDVVIRPWIQQPTR